MTAPRPKQPVGEWLPIETAPRDGTVVDLWVVDRYVRRNDQNKGERYVNAKYGTGWKYMYNSTDSFDGWATFENCYTHQVEMDLSGGERFATHWMPLPEPPK